MKPIRRLLFIFLFAALASCSLPVGDTTPGMNTIYTLAAQTVNAELTHLATPQPSPTPTSLPVLISSATATLTPPPVWTSTPSPVPCNAVRFITDVTVPDGTAMTSNQLFTKTWRLKNIGTCTWNSAYSLVFDHENAMGGPVSQPLTTGTVAPGEMLDVSVILKAPVSAGIYKGYWILRDANGVTFGLKGNDPFWISIVVDPSLPHELIANYIAAESGSVRSNGLVRNDIWVGDTTDNAASQVFLSFDISSLPFTATIVEGGVTLSNGYSIIGDPFGKLGCMGVFQQDYIPLDTADFFAGAPTGAFTLLCEPGTLDTSITDNDFKAALQAKLGSTRIQFRLQFRDKLTNNDGIADQVRLGTPKLVIKYTLP